MPYSTELFALDAIAVLDALGVERADVYGTSTGGRAAQQLDRHDAWQLLPDIGAPTLVVHGTDDLLNPAANTPLLAERIPGARLHLIPGARHAYVEENRAVASPLVLDFLTTVPQP